MTAQDVTVPEYFAVFIHRYFGELGDHWISEIPNIVHRYAERWQLTIREPFDGLTYNYVTPVHMNDGTPAVLKVGVPEPEQRSEIFALRAFAGRGIARLYDFDIEDQVALMELIVPGTLLATLFPGQDSEATAVAARIMNELATPAPSETTPYSSVEAWATNGMHSLRQAFEGQTGPFPRQLVERAESLFDDLIASTDLPWLIHGDLHHMNILWSDARNDWLAIDPKGVIGDRAYETAPFILNPNTAIHSAAELRSILSRRIDIFTEQLDLDRQRIHGWALAFSILSAWWGFDRSGSWKNTLELTEQLAAL